MEELTFKQLYQSIITLTDRINNLEVTLTKNLTVQNHEPNQFMTVKQAANLLNLAVTSVYGLVQRAEIPYYKRGKRLYFSEEEILAWIQAGRRSTMAEIQENARKSLYTSRERR